MKLLTHSVSFCHNSRIWQTDGRTDRRTDSASKDRATCSCSAVTADRQL